MCTQNVLKYSHTPYVYVNLNLITRLLVDNCSAGTARLTAVMAVVWFDA